MIEFQAFPKIARLFREVTITEKIDGTNGAIGIVQFPFGWHVGGVDDDGISHDQPRNAKFTFGTGIDVYSGLLPDSEYLVYAQSRNRVIVPEADNHGFAKWVYDNAASLVADLGPGLHFGEWWGSGIGRNYGLTEKRFSLFNTKRWAGIGFDTPQLGVVPMLYQGEFSTEVVTKSLELLKLYGSHAAPGFTKPEGVVIYHGASNALFKTTIERDEEPKSLSQLRREEIELAA